MTTIYRQSVCYHCGAELEHARTGRPKRFCSTRCRVAHRRAMKRWAHKGIDAILAGEPNPARPGHDVRIECYETDQAGAGVTKRDRSGKEATQ